RRSNGTGTSSAFRAEEFHSPRARCAFRPTGSGTLRGASSSTRRSPRRTPTPGSRTTAKSRTRRASSVTSMPCAKGPAPRWAPGTSSDAGSAIAFWPRRLLGREVGGREAAVNQEGRGRDVGGLVAGQEERRLRDLAGLAKAAHGHVHEPPRGLLGLGG